MSLHRRSNAWRPPRPASSARWRQLRAAASTRRASRSNCRSPERRAAGWHRASRSVEHARDAPGSTSDRRQWLRRCPENCAATGGCQKRKKLCDRGSWSASFLIRLRGEVDRFADTYIGSTAADVAAHGIIDVGIARMWIACQERRSRHDLSGLAVAALDDLMVKPGFLDLGACRRVTDRLDCRDPRFAEAVDAGDAGPCRDAIDMHGARAALRDAAPEFGAGHTEYVSQHP